MSAHEYKHKHTRILFCQRRIMAKPGTHGKINKMSIKARTQLHIHIHIVEGEEENTQNSTLIVLDFIRHGYAESPVFHWWDAFSQVSVEDSWEKCPDCLHRTKRRSCNDVSWWFDSLVQSTPSFLSDGNEFDGEFSRSMTEVEDDDWRHCLSLPASSSDHDRDNRFSRRYHWFGCASRRAF